MARNPHLRASDADRDKVASVLREHHAQGRLTLEEFQERLEHAYVAKTFGDLDAVVADLPEEDLYQLPVPARQATQPAPRTRGQVLRRRVLLAGGWSTWAFVSAINLVIWVAISIPAPEAIYPWWIWVAGPWGAAMLLAQIATNQRHRR